MTTPQSIDVTSFFCPPGKYLKLRAELQKVPGGLSYGYNIWQHFQDSEGAGEGNDVINEPPLCIGPNGTVLFSDDGYWFYIFDS